MEKSQILIDLFSFDLIKYKKPLEKEPDSFSHYLTINSLEKVIINLAIKWKYKKNKIEMENKEIIESICATLINNMNINISVKLDEIDEKLNQLILIKKDVLTLKEACEYLSISKSHMYKYTMNNTIKCFRPNGKSIYFKRSDLDNWMLTNK